MRWRCWSRCAPDCPTRRRAGGTASDAAGTDPAARRDAPPRPEHRRRVASLALARRTARPRPIVLVCDISGSMERYSRFMLRFAHALAAERRAGRGVRVRHAPHADHPRARGSRSPDTALQRGRARRWWTGAAGPGSARASTTLNRRWVRRTIRSGAIVLHRLRRVGARRPRPPRPARWHAPPVVPSAPLARPAGEPARASSRRPPDCRRRCPTWTTLVPCGPVVVAGGPRPGDWETMGSRV